MSYLGSLLRIAIAPNVRPVRTRTPMRLSQDSALKIKLTPMILAEDAGSLFKPLPTEHSVTAVGQLSLFGLTYYRICLSRADDAFIQFATRAPAASDPPRTDFQIYEQRLYRLYDTLPRPPAMVPLSPADWDFWTGSDGMIGDPTMRSRDVDGGVVFQRSWGGGDQRLDPYTSDETLVASSGATSSIRHTMMHYTRTLTDPQLSEHLLVSADVTQFGSSINLWIGIDFQPSDLTAFAAADAPL